MWAHRSKYFFGLVSLVIVDAINVALPLAVREAVDAVAPKNYNRILWAGILYLVLMAIQSIGRYLWRIYLIGTSHTIAQQLRLELYEHFQKLPLKYYQKVRTGDLMSRATNDVESIRMAVGPGILVTVDAIFMFLLITPVMFYLSPKLSLLAFAFYPIVPWLTARLGDRIDTLFEAMQVKMSAIGAYAQESFSGIRLIKSLVLESRVHQRFSSLSQEYEREGIRLAKYQAVFSPTLTLLTNFGTFFILLLGGKGVLEGLITVGTFVAFQRFVVQLSWPMEAIGWAVTMNKEGSAAYRRILEVMQTPKVQSHRPIAGPRTASEPLLNVKDLFYRYDQTSTSHEPFSIHLSDLHITKGKKVGLVGAVGAGKTTFFNCLLRLFEPPEGAVYLGGTDILDIPLPELRRRIGSVEQQVFLFSEKIAVNIALGRQQIVTMRDVEAASRVSCIYDEIAELEKGFETPLGERGINLSGGQKQRVALARALVRQPQLLLLDDCFSAVDVDIEQKIVESFFKQYPDLALCFASHRLSVMSRMDEIWLIGGGRLIDRGDHHSLLKTNKLYQMLWDKSARQVELEKFSVLQEGGSL